ncbi:uncharacterized protein LOC119084489 [Bradysia coprophila]|uniref:uncharacterized protein LOC119084489 n=1 Tax=Bradysia coprophila TaxID=38358 RepID=UPI00187DAD26|nr:uncharacterized protein LOC119084489 [Bradysia coprophila]XP_037050389.1 uncharacterized protein LOC119084489 [Bradysia coprophila]
MSKLIALYLLVCCWVCITSLVSANAVSGPNCAEPQSPMMNWLGDFANKYKQIYMCNHKTDSRAIKDDEGRWYASYRANTNLSSEKEADQLCECMKKFLLQEKGWSQGSVAVCKLECTSLTVFVIGARNADFIDLKPVTQTCEPVKILGTALEHYSDAQLGGINCISTIGRTNTGQFTITAECENDPKLQETCEIMFEYLNAGGWLTDTTTHACTVKNNKLQLEIVEKTVMGYCY